ncbi:hypothetical protein L210DRAFT_880257 [Boletus edulis BED1]|uniref:DUF6570 domain-containing protein n=1 Tax=Boletus edulis BED1 TaxID=1328754 RepID=A0AAD4BCA1_BOLED|nr:hypothetical protein L210DRAFT_880257 [Boletus edulis BED1]
MIEGEFLPHHPNILAATIGVTLVGAKNVPDRSLPGFLRVSRERIRDALAASLPTIQKYLHIPKPKGS